MCSGTGSEGSVEELLLRCGEGLQAAKSARSKGKRCRALGCTVRDLGGRYNRKKRLCEQHMKAPAIEVPESRPGMWRYCQQCGKLEPLARFEGTKRSCRTSLVKRKANAEKMHQRLQQQQTEEQPPKRCQQRMRPMQLVAVAVDAMKLDGGAPAVAAAAAGAVHAVNFMGVLGGGSDHSSCSASAAGPVAALCDAWTAVGQQEQQGWVPAGAANADTDMLSALVQREISSALAAAASLPGSQQQLAYIAEASATAADEDDLTELEIEAMIEAELAAAGLINNGQLACCTASAPVQQQQWSGAHAAPDFYASSTPAAAAELHSRMTSLHAEYAQLQQVLSGLEQLVGQPRPYAAGGAQQQLNMYSVSGNHSSGSWC